MLMCDVTNYHHRGVGGGGGESIGRREDVRCSVHTNYSNIYFESAALGRGVDDSQESAAWEAGRVDQTGAVHFHYYLLDIY